MHNNDEKKHHNMDHCGHDRESTHSTCHGEQNRNKIDYLLWTSGFIILVAYVLFLVVPVTPSLAVNQFTSSTYEMINTMSWGILLGIVFIGLLGKVPREFIIAILGNKTGPAGIARAAIGGVLLDLCSHGILMVGAKLYERGASLGQTMAFLIASPWNSISLTLILWAMVGFKWMITFLLLSMLIAFVSGMVFEKLVEKKVLPVNPNRMELPADFRFFHEAGKQLSGITFSPGLIGSILWNGLKDARMVLRWIFFGVILAALIRTLMAPELFSTYFGPTVAGLGLTIIVATILEVCSEGTLPVAADLLTRANAPGNSFTFLMTGVSTDYTEIMVLREATGSWRISLFLPLVTLPQVIVLGIILNLV